MNEHQYGQISFAAGVLDEQQPVTVRGAFSYIHSDAEVGKRTIIFPHVYIGPNVIIGEDCVIGPGACIGQPGFGYESEEGSSELIYREHTMGVWIGDRVHVGANACIDQGRHRPTKIGDGTKIDNLVHIAHNVEIGEDCMIIALSEISGSVVIGDRVTVSPSASVRDWITIGDDAHVGMSAAVVHPVPAGETWAGVPARKFR